MSKQVGYIKNKEASKLESKEAKQVVKSLVIRPARIDTTDVGSWKEAINAAKRGNRIKLYNLYDNLMADPVLGDAVDKLVGAVTNAEIMFQKDGQSVEAIEDMMDTIEFETMLREIALKFVWGKSLIETSFSPKFSAFSIPRKHIHITNLDKPLSERRKFIAAKENDLQGYDYTRDEFFIECGDDDDLGLLLRATLFVVYKRGGWGDWSQFLEKFAMPFLVGEYEAFDETTRNELFKALAAIGSNPYAAVPKGVNLQVHGNNSGSSSGSYDDFTDKCDRQILIALLGNTMTTMEGSSRAQGEVHMQTQEERFRAIRRYTQRILNTYFIPLLIKRGYDVAGGFFSFPDAGETISTKERVDMALKMRKDGLPVDENYIFEISGVAKKEDAQAEKSPEEKPAEKQDDSKKTEKDPAQEKAKAQHADNIRRDERGFFLKLWNGFFAGAPTLRSGARRLSDRLTRSITGRRVVALADDYSIDITRMLNEAIREVYGSGGDAGLVNKNLFDITNEPFEHVIDTELKDVTSDNLAGRFKDNAAAFAAFKNHLQTEAFVEALTDENGNIRSFRQFRRECLKIGEKFNEQYLRTEYNTLQRALQIAAQMARAAGNLELYPNLEYLHTMASHPDPLHETYVGTILPFVHEAWRWLLPPSRWGCDCRVRPTDKDVTKAPERPEDFDPVFDNNPYTDANFVNLQETTYYKNTPKNLRAQILKEVPKLLVERRQAVTEVYKGKKGGYLEIVPQNRNERAKNLETYKYMADRGRKYTLLPESDITGVKNPDAWAYDHGMYSDAKHPESASGKNAMQNAISSAGKQRVQEVVIHLSREYAATDLFNGLKAALQGKRAEELETIILIRMGREPLYLEVEKLRRWFDKKGRGR